MKLRMNILLSFLILVVGFLGQYGIVNVLGLTFLGYYVIIRLINSEGFVSFYDFGLTEESLYKDSLNKSLFIGRILLAQLVILSITVLGDDLFDLPVAYRLYYFFLLESSYLVFLLRLNLRKSNLIHVIRNQDLLIGILAPGFFLVSRDIELFFIFLTLLNFLFVIWGALFSNLSWIVFVDTNASVKQSLNFYLSTLAAKAEGSLMTLILPTVTGNYSSLGLYDLVFKIPKAFKSQLGELNSLIKIDYINTGNRHLNFRNMRTFIFIIAISLLAFVANFCYLEVLAINEVSVLLFMSVFELFLGVFYAYANIEIVDLFRDHDFRLKYNLFSLLRTVTFLLVVFFWTQLMSLEFILCVWYSLSCIFLAWVYSVLIDYRRNNCLNKRF